MKKILYTLFITALFISCTDDEFIEGTSVGFFPTGAAAALEEDGIANAFSLQAIGEVNGPGSATITLTNYEFIATTPAHTNGVIEVSFNNSKEAFLTVEALDDDFDYNYQAVFTVTSVSGALQGIANSRFTFNVEDDDVVAFFEDDFESRDISKWETVDIAGNSWGTGSFSGNTYADISNFNANGVTEGWLVSPEIDFSAILNPVLSFETQARFGGDLSPLSALILTNYTGDPAAATQQVLTYTPDPHEGAGFGDLTPSGEINLADVTGSARIAFHYAASDASDGSGWSVDNVLLNFFDPDNSDGIPNDQGGNGGGGGGGDSIDISDARGMDSETVTITGIVTTPDFGFTAGNYFIQDETGGITITHFDNNGLVSSGDNVTLTGEVGAFNDQIQLIVDVLIVNSSGNSLPAPISITGTDITINSQYQGMRVTISNVSLVDDSQWPTSPTTEGSGTTIDATDGNGPFDIRIDRGESIFDGSSVPGQPFTLTGIMSRFTTDAQVMPFVASDIN